MRFVDEFRDRALAKDLAAEIARLIEPGRRYHFMEVCGGHTHTIYKHGVEDYLPPSITLVHGPGCPVCVIPMGRLDDAIHIAKRPGIILTTFGDMMRVPGGAGSFLDANAEGADIRMVYSPVDALKIARRNPDRHVVFLAIGFETTAPSTALTLLQAEREQIGNFSIFCNHVTIVPAIKAILDSPDLRLDGFLGPGHVSTAIGCRPYQFIVDAYRRPVVVAGFEPLDVLQSILMLLGQLAEGRCEVENQYRWWIGKATPTRCKLSARPWSCGPISSGAAWASSRNRLSSCVMSMRASMQRIFEIPGIRVARPQSLPVRRSLKRRSEAVAMQSIRDRVYARRPHRHVHGFFGRRVCAAYYNFGRFTREREREAAMSEHRAAWAERLVREHGTTESAPETEVLERIERVRRRKRCFVKTASRWRMAPAERPAGR